ncbi:TetR/AcrR family transcriptional regulator [Streptomonospora arabica]|uniref:TetR/AcrR family transcriptional regulator n=1 Tax=Streptomonospora arabica TaxID=412417 RepID=A0ABV9SR93_9ACTN
MTTHDNAAAVPDNDPTPALKLLWGVDEPHPSRGPRQGLTRERVVQAAIEVAEAEGLAALSMRRVAQRLEVGTASLYTYVPGKPELLALMLDAMIGDGVLPHTLPGGWREQLEAAARSDWEGFRRHPWILQLASDRPLPGPNLMAWFDSALSVLEGTGLTDAERFTVVEGIDGLVRGMARNATDPASDEGPGESAKTWRATRDAFLEEHVDFGRYPHFAAALGVGAPPGADEVFEFGLRRMLDGVEGLMRERGGAD